MGELYVGVESVKDGVEFRQEKEIFTISHSRSPQNVHPMRVCLKHFFNKKNSKHRSCGKK